MFWSLGLIENIALSNRMFVFINVDHWGLTFALPMGLVWGVQPFGNIKGVGWSVVVYPPSSASIVIGRLSHNDVAEVYVSGAPSLPKSYWIWRLCCAHHFCCCWNFWFDCPPVVVVHGIVDSIAVVVVLSGLLWIILCLVRVFDFVQPQLCPNIVYLS